ncbi:spirocyclase AveC family protein [Novosphingobium sp. fls2-241-R2A-195]|jgi:hypothetical protein|uniref:spirocyclase AveC family protein n=1 Tax=Novosphingobium sp. fls2-241-R2A-195 TaxID=3040296 RepID=UPI00254FB8E7|nr:spirocyclase AveC family protein [Novosphingobium sp. fls2-241-R2A-195]
MNRMSPQAHVTQTERPLHATATKVWIGVGAFWVALFAYCMIAWVTGPDFRPNTFGHSSAPASYVLFLRGLEVAMLALTAWILWRFILGPLVRDRRFSFEGLYFLACFTMVVQEPWHSWVRPQLLYNDLFFNMGSWMGTLPVSNPTAHLTPLPLAFAGLGYFWIYGLPAYAGAKIMDRINRPRPGRNRPRFSPLQIIAIGFAGFCVFDLVIESFILRTGMFVYPSTIPALTLFAGTAHQFPLYEMVAWAGTYTFAASLLHFRDARGETVADRHVDMIAPPGKRRTLARWLALVGFLQTGILVTYNLPYMFWALHGGPFTISEAEKPWLTAGMCGPSTAYDCPGPGVPFARRDSATNRIPQELSK